jgi:hypothetical protein
LLTAICKPVVNFTPTPIIATPIILDPNYPLDMSCERIRVIGLTALPTLALLIEPLVVHNEGT